MPIGTRLKNFYDHAQIAGETIRYAYDLQERLNRVQRREPARVTDAEKVLKEQLVLGLKDDFLRREMKRRINQGAIWAMQRFSHLLASYGYGAC